MDRFEAIRVFIAVVEAGSFTAAADRLGLAKSAVSRRVGALEARLGAALINRTTRRQSVTEAGRAFYERATRLLADLDEAEAVVAREHGELRGRLRVALPLSFGIRHMCEPIADFARRHPGIEFDLDLNDRRVDLVEAGADLGIRIGHLEDSSLIARRLFDARTVVCASEGYLRRAGVPATPEALAQHDCLVYGHLREPGRWRALDAEGRDRSVDVRVALIATSGEFLVNAAIEGLGIVIQPTFIAGESIRRGDLQPILTDFRWPVTPAWAVYPPARQLSSRVRAFIDFVAERFAGTPYWDEDCEVC